MAGTDSGKALIPWLIVLGLWAVLHGAMATKVDPRVLDWELTGPDEYMHLVRAAELRDGSGWYDTVIERSNAPYGDALHWTRPMDVLLLSGAYALSTVLSAEKALFVSGAAISPAIALLLCFAVGWAFLPLLGRERAALAAILVLIQPAVLAYTAAGRADHHALLFLLFALAAGATLRLLDARATPVTAAFAGIAYGLAAWASIEMIFLVALCQAAVALAWIRVKDFGARAPFVAAAAFLGTMVVALAAEHPPAALLAAEVDRLSLPHVVVAALCCAVWGAAWTAERRRHAETPARRAALIGAAGAAGMLILAAAFPALVAGPFSQVDPRVLRIWDARVGELDTLVPTDLRHAGNFLYLVGAAVPCVVYAWAMAWRRRNDAPALPWMFAALLLAGYLLLALRHVRVAPFAEIAAAPVLAEMIGRLLDWSRRQVNRTGALLLAAAAAFMLTAGGLVAGSHLLSRAAPVADAAGAPAPQCRISRIAPVLNDSAGLGATPLTVAALLDHGPEILYRTQHAVVGAPYHRNGAGIWDSYRLFAASEEAESRDIAARRRIGLLLVCPSRAERLFFTQETGRNNLYTRLLDGTVPAWLAPVPMEPERADGFRLYQVIR